MLSKGGNNYAYIQVRSVEAAATAALERETNSISNQVVQVEAAHPWHQPDHILSRLNDDCLLNIFKRLEMKTILAVAQVCVRFKQQAIAAFKQKYKHVDVRPAPAYRCRSNVESLLRHFGSVIHSFNVDVRHSIYDQHYVLDWLREHCTSDLKNLTLVNFNWWRCDSSQMLPHCLEQLSLIQNQFQSSTKPLIDCKNLKELHLVGGKIDDWIIQKIEKLEKVDYESFEVTNVDVLINFLTLNSTLTKLCLSTRTIGMKNATELIRCIGNIHNLQELELVSHIELEDMNECPGQFKHLRVLKCGSISPSIAPLLESLAKNRAPIEHLEFCWDGRAIDAIKHCIELKQLKKLHLSSWSGEYDEWMDEIGRNLPQLQELHLMRVKKGSNTIIEKIIEMLPHAKGMSFLKLKSNTSIDCTQDQFNRLNKIVENRPKRCKLKIELSVGCPFEIDRSFNSELLDVIFCVKTSTEYLLEPEGFRI